MGFYIVLFFNFVEWHYDRSAATKIMMSDDGILHLGPATVDMPFLKSGLKEKLDLSVEVRRRAQYKSAGNIFVRDEFDEFHKEQYTDLIQHLERNFIDNISRSRYIRPYATPKSAEMIKCFKWIVEQITSKHENLEFKMDEESKKESRNGMSSHIKEEKSDEVEESLSGSDVEDEWESTMSYLVHCWSHSLGDYKHPVLFVVLQFWDNQKGQRVFYEATVKHPEKRLGL